MRVYNASCFTVTVDHAALFDVMLTDPPFRKHVHKNATSQSKRGGTRKRDLGFQHLSLRARRAVALWSSCVRRWSIVHSDVESSNLLSISAQVRGVEYVRTMPWVRWSMPQLSGDRPPQGFEHIVVLHRKGRKRWNGPGNHTHFKQAALRGESKHKAEKPLDLALDLVSFFSDPGEHVFDPFAGAGTFGLACRLLGREYTGYETSEFWSRHANRRLVEPLSPRDRERVKRWLAQQDEPEAQEDSPNSARRATARATDKARVRAWLDVSEPIPA